VEVRVGNAWLPAEGSSIELTQALPNGLLAPGATSAPVEITFRLTELRLPSGARGFSDDVSDKFLRFDSAILSTRSLPSR